MRRVLSIDGGGIRGLIPAVVCQKLEEWSGRATSSLFDLIAGSSTGGIIAMGLTLPPHGISAATLVEFFLKRGKTIFSGRRSWIQQQYNPKFENLNLHRAAAETFGSIRLSEAIIEVLVTTYDTELRRPVYLRREEARNNRGLDFMMRDIAVATSAAPTFFPSYKLGNHAMIDGGIVANNPACAAYAHAKRLWPKEEILLISIGTGTLTEPLSPEKTGSWGRLAWIKPLIDCLFDGSSHAVDDFFRQTNLCDYTRLQSSLNERTQRLDGVSDAALMGLEKLGTDLANNNEGILMDLIERLKRGSARLETSIITPVNEGFVRPGELSVVGSIRNYREEALYVFTGQSGRYWPSARIRPENNRWTAQVNVGDKYPDAQITVAQVDQQLADYIELYRSYAGAIDYPGIQLTEFPPYMERVHVYLDHRGSPSPR
jgi:predicted acylesterase/phospholipase RssA